jgi:phage terminase large subunit GpA-like protein
MSRIVATKLGRFRAVTDGDKKWWLWECPDCKTWGNLSIDQMEGRVSVHCTAPKQHHYPTSVHPCGYHQTHEFAKELATTIQARMVMGEEPWEEDNDAPKLALFTQDDDGKFVPYDHNI